TESNKNSNSAKKTAEDTQKRFDVQINGQDKDDEVKDARVSKADGKTYNILKDRLDAMDKKSQQTVDNLEIDGVNLLLDTLTPRVFTGTGASNVIAGDDYLLTKGELSRWVKSGVNYSLSFDWSVSAGASGTFQPHLHRTPWSS